MIRQLFYISVILVAGVLLNSCDKCDPSLIICPQGNYYVNGCNCVCVDGYEGADCTVISREKFLWNNYQVNSSCNPNPGPPQASYNSQILQGNSSIDHVVITNFAGRGLPVDAFVTENTIYIPSQSYGTTLEVYGGTGTFQTFNNSIVMQLDYSVSNYNYQCQQVTFYRQ